MDGRCLHSIAAQHLVLELRCQLPLLGVHLLSHCSQLVLRALQHLLRPALWATSYHYTGMKHMHRMMSCGCFAACRVGKRLTGRVPAAAAVAAAGCWSPSAPVRPPATCILPVLPQAAAMQQRHTHRLAAVHAHDGLITIESAEHSSNVGLWNRRSPAASGGQMLG